MCGYIGKIQRGASYSPPSSSDSFIQRRTPELAGDNGSLTPPSSTSSLPPSSMDSPPIPSTTKAIRNLYNIAARSSSSFSSRQIRQFSEPEQEASGSQFDSLQDLLERAGYKETRIVTPDRHGLANMASRIAGTPSTVKTMAGSPSTSPPSDAIETLRQTIRRNFSNEVPPTPKTSSPPPLRTAKSAGWLFASFWRGAVAAPDVPTVPSITVTQSQEQPQQSASPSSSKESRDLFSTPPGSPSSKQKQSIETPKSPVNSSSSRTSTPKKLRARGYSASPKSSKRTLRKKASRNQLWQGSVAYRKAKSNTAPVRGKAKMDVQGAGVDTMAAADLFLEQLGTNKKGKQRPGLVSAFMESPTKGTRADESPSKQRKWRSERAAWRESLSELQDMNAAGRQNSAVTAPAAVEEEADGNITSQLLLAQPALPFLTMDPAVALRNEACLRPAHLSLKRIKSVEVLARALQNSQRLITDKGKQAQEELPSGSPGISAKRPSPPRLTISSPSGVHSPKELELSGQEFEPRSWSPKEGKLIISSHRVPKRSKKGGLKKKASTESVNKDLDVSRGRSTSPRKTVQTPPRDPIAPLIRSSAGSLSRSSEVQALRFNATAMDKRQPLSFGLADNVMTQDDPFRSNTVVKKKNFIRGSKVMDENSHVDLDSPTIKIRRARKEEGLPSLSSSLSRKSGKRMKAITRALGEGIH